jgi:hypothetical protein
MTRYRAGRRKQQNAMPNRSNQPARDAPVAGHRTFTAEGLLLKG